MIEIKKIFCCWNSYMVILVVLASNSLSAQNSNLDIWTGIKVNKELNNGLSLTVNPEWRINPTNNQNELLFETGLSYRPFKYIELGAKYRFSSIYETETNNEINHQLAFDVKGRLNYQRLKFQLRTRLSNYSDFETDNYFTNPYLRYRLQAAYNIKDCKITPSAAVEFFHQLDDAEINKVRYTAGLQYKINKHNYISLNYHYQNYLKKEKAKHIIAIQYKIKF